MTTRNMPKPIIRDNQSPPEGTSSELDRALAEAAQGEKDLFASFDDWARALANDFN